MSKESLICAVVSLMCAFAYAQPDYYSEFEDYDDPTTPIKPEQITAAGLTVSSQKTVSPASQVAARVDVVKPANDVKPTESDVASVFAAEFAKEENVNIAAILSVALEKITEADAPAVAAALYSHLVRSTVKDIKPAELVKIRKEWYEKFHAVEGSKMYWILRIAKERAERGEDVSKLKKSFDLTMKRWLSEGN